MASESNPAQPGPSASSNEAFCAFCSGDELRNRKHEPEQMLVCSQCGSAGHPSCLLMRDPRLIATVRTYPWCCLDCRQCEACGGNDESLFFCDLCDRAYHGTCLDPPLSRPPKGRWICPQNHPVSAASSRRSSIAQTTTPIEQHGGAEAEPKRGKGKNRAVDAATAGVGDPAASLGPRVKLPSGYFGGLDVERSARTRKRRFSDAESAAGSEDELRSVEEEGPDLSQSLDVPDQFSGLLSGHAADLGDRVPTPQDRKRFERARAIAEPRPGPSKKKKTLVIPRPASASTLALDSAGYASGSSSGVLHLRARQPHEITDASVSGREGAISRIRFGQYDIDTWYQAPYPEEFARVPDGRLWLCEYCLKYMKSSFQASRHRVKCRTRHPPGDEIYRDGAISVFEVDGRKNKIYCQNLCLFAKMFLDHKTLYYDVDPFLFYVMTRSEPGDDGAHFVGYFSKEKRSPGNNVSCIASLPSLARQGWGNLLISFSYLLSMKEGRIGTPEKPLSDLYRSYWTEQIYRTLLELPDEDSITLDDISRRTAITPEEIYYVLKDRHLISTPEEDAAAAQHASASATPSAHLAAAKAAKRKRTQEEYGEIEVPSEYRIHFNRADLEDHIRRVDAKGYPKIKRALSAGAALTLEAESLRWTPFVAVRAGGATESPQK